MKTILGKLFHSSKWISKKATGLRYTFVSSKLYSLVDPKDFMIKRYNQVQKIHSGETGLMVTTQARYL